MAGISHTDWSWSALIADLDQDGRKDIYVTNGLVKDVTSQDYIAFLANEQTMEGAMKKDGKVDFMKLINAMNSTPIPDYAFRNRGALSFVNEAKARGADVIDCSSGGLMGSATAVRIPRGYSFQVPFAEQIRRDAKVTTMAVGLILHPQQAEDILTEDKTDLIAVGREALFDPNWPLHAVLLAGALYLLSLGFACATACSPAISPNAPTASHETTPAPARRRAALPHRPLVDGDFSGAVLRLNHAPALAVQPPLQPPQRLRKAPRDHRDRRDRVGPAGRTPAPTDRATQAPASPGQTAGATGSPAGAAGARGSPSGVCGASGTRPGI